MLSILVHNIYYIFMINVQCVVRSVVSSVCHYEYGVCSSSTIIIIIFIINLYYYYYYFVHCATLEKKTNAPG